jgi:hypothetical protein
MTAAMTARRTPSLRPGEARCIECNCTDSCACAGGCYWLQVKGNRGVCSSCRVALPRFRELVASAASEKSQ